MRILVIRGENLASLSEPFELDFQREPLRSAGLFAVTGETGAGKSTILDTLCLALYDKFPRVDAAGESEATPDPAGKALNANDPRAILRRGAGRGFAEVDFVARDGIHYRARCELYRAREKSSGALQPRRRSLWRIGDDGVLVAAVDSGIEPVNRRIIKLTDLSFEQFRRTALLAQGDFDAFLRAEANERADLLEKITGAEIYGRLSRLAYERDRQAQQALSSLELRRQQIGLMGDEERLDCIEDRARLGAQRRALAIERDEIVDVLRCFGALTDARTRLERAQIAHKEARQSVLGVTVEREKLLQLAQIESLRLPREAMRAAEQSSRRARQACHTTSQHAVAATEIYRHAVEDERARRNAMEALNRECDRLMPLWRAASTLDAHIENFRHEEAAARTKADVTSSDAARIRALYAQRVSAKENVTAALAKAREVLERVSNAQPLGDRWAEIDDMLHKHAALIAKMGDAQKELNAAENAIADIQTTLSAFDDADVADRTIVESLRDQIAQRTATIEAIDEEAAARNDAELTQVHEQASALIRFGEEHRSASEILGRAQADYTEFEQKAIELSVRVIALRAQREADASNLADALRLGDLADAAADPHTAHLRSTLLDDAACPVCGAREHPFTKTRDAANKLFATLRARREKARRRLAATEEELVDTLGESARVDAQLHGAQIAQEDALRAVSEAAERYANMRERIAAAPEEIALAPDVLKSFISELAEKRSALAGKLDSARKLRGEADRLRKQEQERRFAIDDRRKERDVLFESLRESSDARARLDTQIKAQGERIGSLERSLTPFLGIGALTPRDLLRDNVGVGARLELLGRQWREAHVEQNRLDASLRALEPEVSSLAAKLEAAKAGEALASKALEERQGLREKAEAERAILLDGEATDAHRGRFEASYEAASRAREAARTVLSDATTNKTAIEVSLQYAESDAAEKEKRHTDARAFYDAALASSGHGEAEVEALLSLSDEERMTLRRVVDEADARLTAMETALMQRQADFKDASEAVPPDSPREEFEARASTIAAEIDSLSTRLGVLSEKIAQDNRARDAAAELSREIGIARAQGKIWSEINEAIGSREGDKFRRFAQAVTLEELVALANQRLALLTPRYALERSRDAGSLGLQIVDRELGDERRSTRSLSGGERFLASLALALALAGLEGRDSFVDTLFIDEGFGALDSATLDVAIDALETLQAQGRRVGVISHVESMQQRIATKVCVERRGGGASVVRIRAPGYD